MACSSSFHFGKYYFLFPNSPRMMVLLPERITELRALRAACWAMVLVLLVLPPVIELMRLVLMDPATEEAALVTARWAIFFFSSASF